jgi:nicotinamide mononucleotide transporter
MPGSILAALLKLTEFLATLVDAIRAMWPWEAIAVVLAVVYLLLAIRQNILCWVAAFVSTAIYLVLMFRVGLYMESGLQFFYMAMAIYGWYSWRHGPGATHELQVSSWPLAFNIFPALIIVLATGMSGFVLHNYTDAAMPYVDSFTTWGAIVGTWMVARKIIQNWHYWFVVDSVAIYLYASRGLWLTVLLFTLYLVLIVIGYREWRKCLPMHAQ